jgi:hypothetical protein
LILKRKKIRRKELEEVEEDIGVEERKEAVKMEAAVGQEMMMISNLELTELRIQANSVVVVKS